MRIPRLFVAYLMASFLLIPMFCIGMPLLVGEGVGMVLGIFGVFASDRLGKLRYFIGRRFIAKIFDVAVKIHPDHKI